MKKRLFVLLALLPLLAAGGGQYTIPGHTGAAAAGSASYVSYCALNPNSVGATSIACTINSVVVGDLVSVCTTWLNQSATMVVSDGTSTFSNGNKTDISYMHGQCAYLLSANSGNRTYTVTWAGGVTADYSVIEASIYHTTAGTWHYDTQAANSATSSSATSGNFTTSGSDEVVVMIGHLCCVGATPSTVTIGGNTATQISNGLGIGEISYYLLNTPVTSGAAVYTYGNSTTWVDIAMAYKAY